MDLVSSSLICAALSIATFESLKKQLEAYVAKHSEKDAEKALQSGISDKDPAAAQSTAAEEELNSLSEKPESAQPPSIQPAEQKPAVRTL